MTSYTGYIDAYLSRASTGSTDAYVKCITLAINTYISLGTYVGPTNNDVMCCVYRFLRTDSLYWIYRLLNLPALQGYIDAYEAPLCKVCRKPTFGILY